MAWDEVSRVLSSVTVCETLEKYPHCSEAHLFTYKLDKETVFSFSLDPWED